MVRDLRTRLNRRRLIGGAAGGGAAFALAGTGIPGIVAAKRAPAVIQGSTSFTYWGGLIFSDEANNMLVEEIETWGAENGLEAEVVMINQNETNQKVSAAVESDTMPDALDLGLDLLLLSQTDQLMDLGETFDAIGEAHGGWFPSLVNATDPAKFGGTRTGVPFGSSGNVLFRRTDVLSEAGFTEAPETWQELSEQAREAQTPGVIFGMGFALSNVGDANQQVSVMQSYGGRIANDEGTEATIKSEDTRAYLEWVTTAYEDGLFPPGVTTWDGAGDNTSYLSGQSIFIANTGSVTLAMNDEDPELAEATAYTALPAGPVMQVSPTNPNVRAVPASSGNPEMAKALIEHLANPEFMEAYYNVAIYGPVLQDQQSFPVFEEPVHGGLLDLVKNGTAPAEPDVFNAAYAEVSTTFLIPKMVQRVVVDGYTLDEAMDEAQQAAEAIYAKYR